MMNFKKMNKTLLAMALVSYGQTSYAAEWQKINHFQVKAGLTHDTKTGLMWMRCVLGMEWDGKTCSGKATAYQGKRKILANIESFSYENFNDWRIPSLQELKTLIDVKAGNHNKGIPYINNQVFPRSFCSDNTGNACLIWTSSVFDDYHGYGGDTVDFNYGIPHSEWSSHSTAVRLVRGGQ